MMRRLPFHHADFEILLRQSQMGKLKIYIPKIALEEERTAQLAKHVKLVEQINVAFSKLQYGMLGMLVEGLSAHIDLWNQSEVERNSELVFQKFLDVNKVEVIDISIDHATKAWARYFNADLPFNRNEEREARRKDIPDSWILEAGIEVKPRKGSHCALVGDEKLAKAFEAEGFKVYRDAQTLLDDIEQATAVVPLKAPTLDESSTPLEQLRSDAFKNVDILVLGLIEVLGLPSKHDLFQALVKAGVNRDIAEHEARTMVLSDRLLDVGTHFVPVNESLARQAASTEVVIEALIRIAE